jgi:hypothetical protein
VSTTEFDAECPHCGKLQELHTSVTDPDAVPTPGSISFCFTCGGISAYDEDLRLVHLTLDQMEEIDKSIELQNITRAWLQVRGKRDTDVVP